MISFTQQPEEVALFGVNPQWVEVTTDGSDPDLICELIVYLWDGTAYNEVTRLRSEYTAAAAVFNISKLIDATYDLPAADSFTAYNVDEATNLIKRYKIEAEEYLNEVQQGSTINFEARAINGRHGTLEAMDADFFVSGKQQLLSKKPLTRKIKRDCPEWAYMLTQSNAIVSGTVIIKIYLSDGTTVNDSQSIPAISLYDVHVIPIGFEALGIAAAESGDLFVTKYDVTLNEYHGAGDYDIKITFEIDYDETSWENPILLFQNTRGGMDVFQFKGKTEQESTRTSEGSRKILSPSSTSTNHLTLTDRTTANYPTRFRSGWINQEYLAWAKDMLFIRNAWLIEGTTLVPVNVREMSINQIDDEDLFAFEMIIEKEKD